MMIRKALVFAVILLFILPNSVLANTIVLYQERGSVSDWDEHRYVVEDDLVVHSHISLGLSHVFYNYSNNYTFQFTPFEPRYIEEPSFYSVRIFRECQVSLQNFQEPHINCEDGEELKEDIDFQDIETNQYNWSQKAHKIRIFQNESFRKWTYYDILVTYRLEDFVKKKGSDYYFSLEKRCNDYGWQRCPQGNPVRETVFFVNPDIELTHYPDYAEKLYFLNEIEYLWIEGQYQNGEIRFIDVTETEKWIPFKWAMLGAFAGYVISVFFNWVGGFFIRRKKNYDMDPDEKIFPAIFLLLIVGVIIIYKLAGIIDPPTLEAILVFILVALTALYAGITLRIARGPEKNRTANYIQNQLAKFYTPLLTNEHFWASDYERFYGARIQVKPSNEQDRLIKEFSDVYRRYKHYASTDLEGSINKLENYIRSGHQPSEMTPEDKKQYEEEYDEFKKEFNALLEKDYERLQEELKTLFLKKR